MKSKKKIRLIRRLLLAVMIVCLIPICRDWYLSAKHKEQRNILKEKVEQSGDDVGEPDAVSSENEAGGTGPEGSAEETGPENEADGTGRGDRAEETGPENDAGGTGPEDRAEETGPENEAGGTGRGDRAEETGSGNEAGGTGQESGAEETGGAPSGNDTPEAEDGEEQEQETGSPVMLRKYAALKRENDHFAGWLMIDGTGIDYPVMQCEDDEYYLHHDFYGEDSKYGCLYVRERADLESGTNFVIYGHNMRDGAMFGNLDYYLKESFFLEHPTISFDTLYEERVYEIVAVFRSQVYNAEDDVFKYYQFYQADTREEFDDFYTNIKALSIYDTGVEAEFGDTFLTCSTCAYHVQDGRLVVVAKRVE